MAPKKSKRSTSGKGSSKDHSSPHQGHPEDIVPLVLTSDTQNLFGLFYEDVTEQSQYKLLKKDDIIQDIKSRAAVSDFSPVMQIVLDYPEEEILLVFDPNLTYGKAFYLDLTPEAKDQILKIETQEEFDDRVYKTLEPKPWISLGSEKEIEEESVKETREKLKLSFFRKRESFGLPLVFSSSKTTHLEFPSYKNNISSTKVMLKNCSTQAGLRLQDCSAQTHWNIQKNESTQYTLEFNQDEKEWTLQDESIKIFLNVVAPRMLHALQQEVLFFDEWKSLGTGLEAEDQTGQESVGLLLHKTFTDQKYTKNKTISSINWHPTIFGIVAVALMERIEGQSEKCTDFTPKPSFIVVYSLADSSNAKLLLQGPDDITAFQFCPSNANIIVGGCANGQIAIWDISAHVTVLLQSGTHIFDLDGSNKKKIPVVRYSAASALKNSHKELITDVQWLPETFEQSKITIDLWTFGARSMKLVIFAPVTRTGRPVENQSKVSVQFITCSPDCTLLFWDVRLPKLLNLWQKIEKMGSDTETFKHLDMTWKPLRRVSLSKIDSIGEHISLKFSLDPYTGPRNAENASGTRFAEDIPDDGELRIPSAKTLKTLEDVNTKIYVGTQDGEIIYVDWKSEKDVSEHLYSAKPLHCFSTRISMVNTVQRSPFLKDIILKIGTCNFAIFKEGVTDGPLFVSRFSKESYTSGCWSLSRPAVFFVAKEHGTIELWNLLENANEPSQVHTSIINSRITCIKPWIVSSKHHFLAVADEHGALQVVEISKKLCVPFRNESLRVKKYFERETKGVKDFLKKQESCVKQKKEEEIKKKTLPERSVKTPKEKKDLEPKEHKDFLMLEESILKSLDK